MAMQSRFSNPLPANLPDALPEAQSRVVEELIAQFQETNRRSEEAQATAWRERRERITDQTALRGARGER